MVQEALATFGDLDGVGPNMAAHLWNLGMRSTSDIAKSNPEIMYLKDKKLHNGHLDRCVLYVYRCVYIIQRRVP